jgi:uncharacterized protein YggE
MKTPLGCFTGILLSFFTVLAPAQAEPEIKGTPAELAAYLSALPGSVQLVGEGEVKTSADRAIVSLRIDVENKSLAEALRENQKVRAKLTAFLKEQGLDAARVQVAPFSSTQRQAVFSDKVKSHKVSMLVKVTTHDEQEFQAVTRSVDQFTEVAYVGAEFEHSKKESLKTQALAKACDEAERQKRVYEERLGVKLVARSIADQKIVAAPLPRRGVYAAGSSYGKPALSTPLPSSTGAPGGEADMEGTPFGELAFSSRVVVEYSVERP